MKFAVGDRVQATSQPQLVVEGTVSHVNELGQVTFTDDRSGKPFIFREDEVRLLGRAGPPPIGSTVRVEGYDDQGHPYWDGTYGVVTDRSAPWESKTQDRVYDRPASAIRVTQNVRDNRAESLVFPDDTLRVIAPAHVFPFGVPPISDEAVLEGANALVRSVVRAFQRNGYSIVKLAPPGEGAGALLDVLHFSPRNRGLTDGLDRPLLVVTDRIKDVE